MNIYSGKTSFHSSKTSPQFEWNFFFSQFHEGDGKLEKKDCLPEVHEVVVLAEVDPMIVNSSAKIEKKKKMEVGLLINQLHSTLCLFHSMNNKKG